MGGGTAQAWHACVDPWRKVFNFFFFKFLIFGGQKKYFHAIISKYFPKKKYFRRISYIFSDHPKLWSIFLMSTSPSISKVWEIYIPEVVKNFIRQFVSFPKFFSCSNLKNCHNFAIFWANSSLKILKNNDL